MPWNAQALADLLGGEARPGRLVSAARWEWLPDRGVVRVEEGVTDEDRRRLASEAIVEDAARWSLRSAQQVLCRPQRGQAVEGGTDPRTGGLAIGA